MIAERSPQEVVSNKLWIWTPFLSSPRLEKGRVEKLRPVSRESLLNKESTMILT